MFSAARAFRFSHTRAETSGGSDTRISTRIGSATTGVAFSFATTYALGHIARDYYAGGRQMSTDLLRARFQQLLQAARQLQGRYLTQIEGQASNLDAGQIMAMVKGPV